MKKKIEQIIDRNTEGNYLLSRSDKAQMISEILDLYIVRKSFTAEEVVNELEDCDTLDDAIMFFKEQM